MVLGATNVDFYVDDVLVITNSRELIDSEETVFPYVWAKHASDNTSVDIHLDYFTVKYRSTTLTR